jgi:DNA repair ATPase RecN
MLNDNTIPDNNKDTESPPVTASQVKWMIDASITKHLTSPQIPPTELSLPELVSIEVKSQMSNMTTSIAATAANQPQIIANQMKTAVQAKLTEFKAQLSNKAPTDWNSVIDGKLTALTHENQQTKLELDDYKAQLSTLLELQWHDARKFTSITKRLECTTNNKNESNTLIQSTITKQSQVEIEMSKRPKLQTIRDETDANLNSLESKVLTEVELQVSAIEAATPLIGGIVMWNGTAKH